jgi:hypothetical protein
MISSSKTSKHNYLYKSIHLLYLVSAARANALAVDVAITDAILAPFLFEWILWGPRVAARHVPRAN